MVTPPRPLFRERALIQYHQRQQQTILPRLVSPPVFIYFWILLGFLLLASGLAWWTQIPVFVTASGVFYAQNVPSPSKSTQTVVLLFLPTSDINKVRLGQSVQLQLVATGQQFTGTVSQIEPNVVSPLKISQHYHLASAAIPTEPSIVVVVTPATSLDASVYAGSQVDAQIQTGMQRVLTTLVPGLDPLIGS